MAKKLKFESVHKSFFLVKKKENFEFVFRIKFKYFSPGWVWSARQVDELLLRRDASSSLDLLQLRKFEFAFWVYCGATEASLFIYSNIIVLLLSTLFVETVFPFVTFQGL